jgi:two-component system sensor histidine kinase DegS
MNNDESSIDSENLGSNELNQLDLILVQIINTMEQSRGDIFDISEESRKQCIRLEVEMEELTLEAGRIIDEVQKNEKLERLARLRLMEVSRNFRSYSEIDIKKAYESARELQLRLLDLRQSEMYLRRRREELTRHINKFQAINQKAESFLSSTGFALKILKGNVERINETIEDSHRNRQLGIWIIQSQEAERRRIARDLHDGPAQNLAGMMIRLDLIQHLWGDDINRIYEEIENIKQMGSESLSEIRRIMFDLKPSLLHEDDFCATLSDFFRDYGAKYDLDIDFVVFGEKKKYDMSLEIALFRMVQESITNIRKHSGANKVLVKMEDKGRSLTLVIKDEGRGFDVGRTATKSESYGIMGMKERVELLGGEVEIISAPGKGTQVIITVPLEGDVKDGQNKSCNSG